MAVERLPGNAQLFTQHTDLRFLVTHRGHRQADLRRGHLVRSASLVPAGAGRGKSCLGAFGDEFAFELGQGGEDPEDELARGRGGVYGRSLAGEDLEPDAALGEVVDGVHQVAQVPSQPIQLPHQQGVPRIHAVQAGRQLGPIVLLARGVVLVQLQRVDPGGQDVFRQV